ncbi:MAG: MopE-related protein [Pseudomonadota bacterium]
MPRGAPRLVALLGLALAWPTASRAEVPALPPDFPLSPITWGGLGGAGSREACGPLRHHPVVLVHDDGEGPEAWFEGPEDGAAGALLQAGFDPCEIWAVRLADPGQPLRSLEELTDDLKYFMGSVLAYTGAPAVQLVARGTGAVLTHATLQKYRLHALVHAVVYLDAPFQGLSDCDETRCFSGEVRCCSLAPGSLLLRRTLLPLEAPEALEVVPDAGRTGRIRYLCLGATPAAPLEERKPARGGWMLDGAANLSFPELAERPVQAAPVAWQVVVEALSDPAAGCDPAHDADSDGFCAREHGGADCDDVRADVHPGAEEGEADGVDQDCNGFETDRRFPGWACERPMASYQAPASDAPRGAPAPGPPSPWLRWLAILGPLLGVLTLGGWWMLRGARPARERRRKRP